MDNPNEKAKPIACPMELNPEALGRKVREVWIAWANEQSNPKPSWLLPWDKLVESDKEVDRRIGMAIAMDVITYARKQWVDQKNLFERHTKSVSDFLNELYSIAVDPLLDGTKEVSEIRAELIAAVTRDRDLRTRTDGANALLAKCFDHLGNEIKRMTLNESAATGTQSLRHEVANYLDTTDLKPAS